MRIYFIPIIIWQIYSGNTTVTLGNRSYFVWFVQHFFFFTRMYATWRFGCGDLRARKDVYGGTRKSFWTCSKVVSVHLLRRCTEVYVEDYEIWSKRLLRGTRCTDTYSWFALLSFERTLRGVGITDSFCYIIVHVVLIWYWLRTIVFSFRSSRSKASNWITLQ